MDPKGPLSEAFSRKTYLKIAIYFTWLFLKIPITPNQVSLLSISIGIIACVLIVQHNWLPILGVILFQIWTILDTVDGDIARYKGICSLTGAYLDRLNHAIIVPLMYISLSYAVYLKFFNELSFLFGFLASFSILLLRIVHSYIYLAILEPKLHKKHINMFNISKHHYPQKNLIQEYLSYSPSSTILRIGEFILDPGLNLGLYGVVLIDTIFNPCFEFYSLKVNFSFLYLAVCGITLPFIWIFIAIYIIKSKIIEILYFQIFSEER
jgi:phosphatidylglycerophosphate synthase